MTNLALTASGLGRRLKDIDRAWLATAVIFAIVAIAAPDQASVSARFTLDALIGIAPFLLFAIAVAAYAKASGADGLIARAFSGRMSVMIVTASVFGGLSPFCSCGVIPLIAALLSMGVPVPAVMAFWLASPLMDPSKFVLATGTLGFDFAVALTLAAVGLGLMGGFATRLVMARGAFAAPLRDGIGDGGCGGGVVRTEKPVVWTMWSEAARRRAFTAESLSTTLFLLKWLTLAFLLESLMIAFLPADAIAGFLGAESAWAIPLAVITGVPAYLNGFAALPLISGLIEMGVMPGAGMAFLVAGAVTSLPAAIAVFALVKKPLFLWYLVLSLGGALAAGLLYQLYAG
ncbi:MAG: permease [Magnetovibrio sp.]|nr:permease [Magnetovibrio sp.]